MIWTIIIFIIILGLLVFVHEFGHFYAAKKSGMRVLEFGFGFPPRLLGFQKADGRWKLIIGHRDTSTSPQPSPSLGEGDNQDNTIYSINSIPLGGFVKIWGENNEYENDPRSFINKPFWNRFITLIAGVVMNVLLAWALISIGFTIGMPTAIDDPSRLPASAQFKDRQTAILEVQPEGNAQAAGILPGDIILKLDNIEFENLEKLRDYIRANAGKNFSFEVKRINENLNFTVPSIAEPKEGEGPTGIVLADIGKLSFPWYKSIWEGGKATLIQLTNIARGLYGLFTSKIGLDSLGGPVKIAQITSQVADLGFIYLLQFTSFLSLNLAILNILPFPALDGGRILFLIIEKIRGVRNNPKIEQAVNAAGFALLILLMILVTIKDVRGFGN